MQTPHNKDPSCFSPIMLHNFENHLNFFLKYQFLNQTDVDVFTQLKMVAAQWTVDSSAHEEFCH